LFEYQIDNLDKEANYLIYCWHGNRTKQVIDIMRSKSFISVKDLWGWIDAWIRAWEEVVSKRKF
jgi:rhodanese-related sulfurtransferase